jgi:hypothetical protein
MVITVAIRKLPGHSQPDIKLKQLLIKLIIAHYTLQSNYIDLHHRLPYTSLPER